MRGTELVLYRDIVFAPAIRCPKTWAGPRWAGLIRGNWVDPGRPGSNRRLNDPRSAGSDRIGRVGPGRARVGSDRPGRSGRTRVRPDRPGQTGSDRVGPGRPGWTGSDWFGPDRPGQTGGYRIKYTNDLTSEIQEHTVRKEQNISSLLQTVHEHTQSR